jgi:hypothetical protein
MKLPVDIRFLTMLRSEPAELLARRRIMQLDSEHPWVLRWEVVCEQPRMRDPSQPAYAARVLAHLADGGHACARSSGPDLLGALSVVLDAVDVQLRRESLEGSFALAWRGRAAGLGATPVVRA